MNKNIFHLTFILLFSVGKCCYAQKSADTLSKAKFLVGTWQVDTSLVTSALHANFKFLPGGRFVYANNEYDDLNPLREIMGAYTFKAGVLQFKVESMLILKGFTIEDAERSFQFGSFQLSGGKIVTVQQQNPVYTTHEIEIMSPGRQPVIKIDGSRYFKLPASTD